VHLKGEFSQAHAHKKLAPADAAPEPSFAGKTICKLTEDKGTTCRCVSPTDWLELYRWPFLRLFNFEHTDPVHVYVALQIVLMLEGVECQAEVRAKN
jgi:hypothetical protein